MNLTSSKSVLLLGASGTIGRATAAALIAAGHEVTCLVRSSSLLEIAGAEVLRGDPTKVADLSRVFAGKQFDAVVSCLASRTGAPADAWAIDHDAHVRALEATQAAGVSQFVLLSAICVQKPKLAFQRAKLAFEERLASAGLIYSIVRPTAYFKSLSGQIARVQAGKSYLLFGDGALTACKPISDGDLGSYLAGCLTEETRWNQVLPIGGPGPALTPKEMGEALFEMTGKAPKFKCIPVAMMDAIIGGLSLVGRFSSKLAAKAELARIGRYYATESMLVWDEAEGRYDADATPETGSETLFDFQQRVLKGEQRVDLGDHSVF